jgi:hypothetical protein
LPPRPDWFWGPDSQPTSLLSEVKREVREADHSSSSNAEVQNAWSYASTLLTRLDGVVLESKGTNLPLHLLDFLLLLSSALPNPKSLSANGYRPLLNASHKLRTLNIGDLKDVHTICYENCVVTKVNHFLAMFVPFL